MIGKRLIASGIVGCLILSFLLMMGSSSAAEGPPMPSASGPNIDYTCDLIAGQHYDIGYVHIWNEGNILYVQFVTEDDPMVIGDEWYMTNTKVSVKEKPDLFPMTRQGNPILGKFEWKMSYPSPGVQISTHMIDMSKVDWWLNGGMPFIAAHADTCRYGGLMGMDLAIPNDPVSIMVKNPFNGGPSYFPELTVSNEGSIDGTYIGWCVDTDRNIYENTQYEAMVYSSLDVIPAGVMEHPENMDLVNWILNQAFVGKMSPGGFGMYTYGDVQRAIWALIDDTQSTAGLGSWDQKRVNEILDAAICNGEGFLPKCGQIFALIFVPIDECGMINHQVIIGQFVMGPCKCQCETAWGEGVTFKEKFGASQWGMFIDMSALMAS